MNKITRIIGSIIVAALVEAIPILTTCAFIFNWGDFITCLLTLIAITKFAYLGGLICVKAEEGE